MDTSMYEFCAASTMIDQRQNMSLDFSSSPMSTRKRIAAGATYLADHTDNSKLASPDLEAFLLYANAGADANCHHVGTACGVANADYVDQSTVNTPTQILFPNAVTAEQEAYARGFVDALEELHRRQGVPTAAATATPWNQAGESSLNSAVGLPKHHVTSPPVVYMSPAAAPGVLSSVVTGDCLSSVMSPLSAVPSPDTVRARSQSSSLCAQSSRTADGVERLLWHHCPAAERAQTVPRLPSLTPPSSPDVAVPAAAAGAAVAGVERSADDCAAAELARMDRKRERNRLAAQKCRSRKLEQIAVLESRCAVLRAENSALSLTAGQLADDVARLREQLAQHTAGMDGSRCNLQHTLPAS